MELKVVGVRAHYEKAEVLKGISLEIGPGEMVSLMGANGAGKTTLLNVISGLKRRTEGEIWFGDQRIDSAEPYEIVRLGLSQVPEGRRLFRNMSVFENLFMGGYLRREKAQTQRNLEQIYTHFPILQRRKNQKAGSLSGGEQQMLAIGRALMAEPRLLLLDEPSIGLSPIAVKGIAQVIGDITRGGISIFLVEQNSRLAFKLSQRGYVLETGKIVLEGKTSDLEKNDHVRRAYLGG